MILQNKFSFLKKNRLLKASEYTNIFQNAQKITGNGFLALFRENNFNYPRLGLIVAKRYIKKATKRNGVKRIIRESFRLHKNEICNLDIIVLIKRDLSLISKDELKKRMDELWVKLKTS